GGFRMLGEKAGHEPRCQRGDQHQQGEKDGHGAVTEDHQLYTLHENVVLLEHARAHRLINLAPIINQERRRVPIADVVLRAPPGRPYLGGPTWAAPPGRPHLGGPTWAAPPKRPYLGGPT